MDSVNLYLVALNDLFPFYLPVLMVVLGGVFGSFLTCALYRVPRGISLRTPASSCPSCHTRLGFFDLIPVFSYIFSGGKCRHCKAKVSPRYLFLELLCVFSGLLSLFIMGPSHRMFTLFAVLLCLVYMLWGWFESKHKPYKVLLFFIILLVVLPF